jgi:hypothetical protein
MLVFTFLLWICYKYFTLSLFFFFKVIVLFKMFAICKVQVFIHLQFVNCNFRWASMHIHSGDLVVTRCRCIFKTEAKHLVTIEEGSIYLPNGQESSRLNDYYNLDKWLH